jgi:hypothetical protein
MSDGTDSMISLPLRVDRDKIALLKFLLEGYDNLAVVSTLDAGLAFLLVSVPEDRAGELCDCLATIQKEYQLCLLKP